MQKRNARGMLSSRRQGDSMQDTPTPDITTTSEDASPERTCTERTIWCKGMAMGIVLCAAGALLPLTLFLDLMSRRVLWPLYEMLALELPGLTLVFMGLHDGLRVPFAFFLVQFCFSVVGVGAVLVAGKNARSKWIPVFLAVLFSSAQVLWVLFLLVGAFLPFASLGQELACVVPRSSPCAAGVKPKDARASVRVVAKLDTARVGVSVGGCVLRRLA